VSGRGPGDGDGAAPSPPATGGRVPSAPERTPTRRFVAGATCPGCGALDTIALDRLPDGDRVLCVDCGHQDHRPVSEGAPAAGPPSGRLDGPVRAPRAANVVALRFHPRRRRTDPDGDG
jgi:uncharacterized metal-binding protein (TIGR02443 family)